MSFLAQNKFRDGGKMELLHTGLKIPVHILGVQRHYHAKNKRKKKMSNFQRLWVKEPRHIQKPFQTKSDASVVACASMVSF